MSAPVRLIGFVVVLVALFGAAVGIGSAVDTNRGHEVASDHDNEGHAGDTSTGGAEAPPGLAVADGHYRLVADETTFALRQRLPFSFRIVDAGGATVRDFDVEHTKRLHLIAVRRDMTGYQHVHPVEAADGSWSVPLRFDAPGVYRVYADFKPKGGNKTTLATDVFVSGDFEPQPLPAVSNNATADGYDVALTGAPRAGEEGMLSFTVSRGGKPVAVEPYLGADGHLVTLRAGDLAYLHTHPQGTPGSGGPIQFMTEYPSVGRYGLFLQFKHDGAVHTVAFTQEVR